MKRILSVLFAVLLLSCSLTACDIADGVGSDLPPVTQHVHIFEKANCQSPKTCECGATEGKPLNRHNFEDGVCVDCEKTLIVELARIVTDPGMEQPKDGFYIARDEEERENYITVRADIVDKNLNQQEIYAYVAIKVDQEAIVSGVYEWAISRSTYLPEVNNYERSTLYGTLNAADFFDVSTLSVTKNEGFSEADVSKYMVYIPTCVDRMMNQVVIPALKGNPSGITVDDLGFVNYAEDVTTK